ncbi:phosphotransferase [Sphingobium sp. EM0848]|uniref:phosphotransferase n=1 Tax=Sphingobium sp. EM0848 TaxID=2743473 RepID=UPI00159C1DC8|nr:phosphotransferase [Sphingobium sp. EM0848]
MHRVDTMPFPRSLEDISAEWLTSALAEAYPGTRVDGLSFGTIIRGMATKAQVHLHYNAAGLAHGLPPSAWIKSGFDATNADLMSHSVAEVEFFRDLAPGLSINLPHSWLQLVDPNAPNGLLMLEDLTLRNARFGRQTTPLEPEEMRRVLTLQAGYHGAYWKSPKLDALGWLKRGGMLVESDVCGIFLDFWPTASAAPRWDHVPKALRDPALIRRAIDQLHANDIRDANCIVHGDAHQGNLFFNTDGTPGYLDWATIMYGHWAFDVAYLMVGSQSVENRRALEKEQLAFYLDALEAAGGERIAFDSAWLAYRQHAMWMFMTTLCPVEFHPEEICVHNAERACTAITDLDSVAALLG